MLKLGLSAAVTTSGDVASVVASTDGPSITEAAIAFSTDPAATSISKTRKESHQISKRRKGFS